MPSPPDLGEQSHYALFLDFDGTLVDIASRPDSIRPDRDLPELLNLLSQKLEGRLAVISGRSLANLESFIGSSEVSLAGSHGGELREATEKTTEILACPLPADVEAQVNAFAAAKEGLLVERKPFGLAVHYRDRPDAEAAVLTLVAELARSNGLAIKRGKMVIELLPPGFDKGRAVRNFMELQPFKGATPIFVGDDITDEDGFKAVLGYGGGGVLVGRERETAARWRLDDVEQVHSWLKAALA